MNEEYYQESGPRDGEMKPLSDTLRIPEAIGPVDCVCQDCGATFQGDLYKWPIRIPKSNYPGAFENSWTERILGGTRCPACGEIKAEEDRKVEEAAKIAEFDKTRREARLRCGIKPKYQAENFSTFKLDGLSEILKKAYRKAWDYAENYPIVERGKGYRSMVLFSEKSWGVGKTHLASAIAHRILDRWTGSPETCPVQFISEPELLLQITATFNLTREEKQFRDSEAVIINRLIFVPLLIIDDVGKRKVPDLRFVQRTLFSIIDGRDNEKRPVVLTANLDSEGLGRYLGGINPDRGQVEGEDEATLDRLIGMCGGHFTKMDGKSYRRHNPAPGVQKVGGGK